MTDKKGFNQKTLVVNDQPYRYYDITSLKDHGMGDISHLPYSYKVLLECAVRNYDENLVTMDQIKRIASWSGEVAKEEIPFIPSRIVLQDFTGVPVVVDLATMRSKMHEMGGDPNKINPIVPVDLVIDHSVMVDSYGKEDSLKENVKLEFERNGERYKLLKWAQNSFSNLRIFPPSIGIIHQVNLEYLATVAATKKVGEETLLFPDSLVGTDSHTTMINGIGVLGWGVGGIEAEACMLGQPLYFVMPEVVGFKLSGHLQKGVTATDLVLTITKILRKEGVVGKFIEFFGEGLSQISVEDRSTVANMCPEYGATCAYFPVDHRTLEYLRGTGRSETQVQLVEAYYKAQGMFRTDASANPVFSKELELDLSTVEPCIAGPKRPQDHILLKNVKEVYEGFIQVGDRKEEKRPAEAVEIHYPDGASEVLKPGAVVIAAITSCTNTSNPYVMMGAGLLAKKAFELGLSKPRYVKSSFGPGSLVVTEYLQQAGLLPYMEKLGFNVVGYGCTTCIGNSGPLPKEVADAIMGNNLTVASVLSGNRNFEGRIHALTKINFLMSPMLVVAFGLAGTVNIDFESEPIGYGHQQQPIYLRDILPDSEEIDALVKTFVRPEIFREKYVDIFNANDLWNKLPVTGEKVYQWTETSTYIRKAPFFDQMEMEAAAVKDIKGANALAVLGDSVTTDHISPAGSIPETSAAGNYLTAQNVKHQDFNSYGSRRGTHEVMMRGTLANIRIRNKMVPGVEGGYTKHIPSSQVLSIYDASMAYQKTETPLIIIAGKEYGTGSSRDWAAKGTALLGVRAVLAESFERIHRSNLFGMGVLPLQFLEGTNAETYGLTGFEQFDILGIEENLYPGKQLKVTATGSDGQVVAFQVIARLDNPVEVNYYRQGGILPMVLRGFLSNDPQ